MTATKFLELEPHMRRLGLRTTDLVWAAVKSDNAATQQRLLSSLQAEKGSVEEERWRYVTIDKADPDHVYARDSGHVAALLWAAKIAVLRYALGDPDGELSRRGLRPLQEVGIAVDRVVDARADARTNASRISALRGER